MPAFGGKLPLPHKHSQLHASPLPVVPVPGTTDGCVPAAGAPGVAAAAALPLPKLMETVLITCGAGFCATSASFLSAAGRADIAAAMLFTYLPIVTTCPFANTHGDKVVDKGL